MTINQGQADKDSGTIFAGAKIAPSSVGRGVLTADNFVATPPARPREVTAGESADSLRSSSLSPAVTSLPLPPSGAPLRSSAKS